MLIWTNCIFFSSIYFHFHCSNNVVYNEFFAGVNLTVSIGIVSNDRTLNLKPINSEGPRSLTFEYKETNKTVNIEHVDHRQWYVYHFNSFHLIFKWSSSIVIISYSPSFHFCSNFIIYRENNLHVRSVTSASLTGRTEIGMNANNTNKKKKKLNAQHAMRCFIVKIA